MWPTDRHSWSLEQCVELCAGASGCCEHFSGLQQREHHRAEVSCNHDETSCAVVAGRRALVSGANFVMNSVCACGMTRKKEKKQKKEENQKKKEKNSAEKNQEKRKKRIQKNKVKNVTRSDSEDSGNTAFEPKRSLEDQKATEKNSKKVPRGSGSVPPRGSVPRFTVPWLFLGVWFGCFGAVSGSTYSMDS